MAKGSADKVTRKQRKAATRRALRQAALQSFVKHGFHRTQISHITEAAGVAQGTFYVHYKDKSQVLDELLSAFNQGLVDRLAAALGQLPGRSLPQLVEASALVFLQYWQENRGFVEVYSQRVAQGITLHRLRDGVNPETTTFLLEQLSAVLGDERKLDRNVNVGLVVQGVLAMWLRIGMQYLFNPNVTQAGALETLVSMTLGAVSGALGGLQIEEGESSTGGGSHGSGTE